MVSFLDGFSVAMLGILWFQVILNYNKLPKEIPVHFDFEGKPDQISSKYYIFLWPVLALALYFFLSFSIDSVRLNLPFEVNEEKRAIQIKIGIVAVKSIIAYVIFMFSMIQKHIIDLAMNRTEKKLPILYLLGALFVLGISFLTLAYLNK